MTKSQKTRLAKAYSRHPQKSKRQVLSFLRAFMPEIIYRTTKLEGESVTRKMISGLFEHGRVPRV